MVAVEPRSILDAVEVGMPMHQRRDRLRGGIAAARRGTILRGRDRREIDAEPAEPGAVQVGEPEGPDRAEPGEAPACDLAPEQGALIGPA